MFSCKSYFSKGQEVLLQDCAYFFGLGSQGTWDCNLSSPLHTGLASSLSFCLPPGAKTERERDKDREREKGICGI